MKRGRISYREQVTASVKADAMYAALAGKPAVLAAEMPAPARKRAAPKPRTEPNEHELQSAVIQWWGLNCATYGLPRYALAAIPNGQILMGSARNPAAVMAYLHKEGFRDGIPDLQLFVPRDQFHGMLIEMKTRTGTVKTEQRMWSAYLNGAGYYTVMCRSDAEAIERIREYLE